MKIECGKNYVMRDGRKTGVLRRQKKEAPLAKSHPFVGDDPCVTWREDGTWSHGPEVSPADIVAPSLPELGDLFPGQKVESVNKTNRWHRREDGKLVTEVEVVVTPLEPPKGLKPGWIAKDKNGLWFWYSGRPKAGGIAWMYNLGNCFGLSALNFNWPDIPWEESLVQV